MDKLLVSVFDQIRDHILQAVWAPVMMTATAFWARHKGVLGPALWVIAGAAGGMALLVAYAASLRWAALVDLVLLAILLSVLAGKTLREHRAKEVARLKCHPLGYFDYKRINSESLTAATRAQSAFGREMNRLDGQIRSIAKSGADGPTRARRFSKCLRKSADRARRYAADLKLHQARFADAFDGMLPLMPEEEKSALRPAVETVAESVSGLSASTETLLGSLSLVEGVSQELTAAKGELKLVLVDARDASARLVEFLRAFAKKIA